MAHLEACCSSNSVQPQKRGHRPWWQLEGPDRNEGGLRVRESKYGSTAEQLERKTGRICNAFHLYLAVVISYMKPLIMYNGLAPSHSLLPSFGTQYSCKPPDDCSFQQVLLIMFFSSLMHQQNLNLAAYLSWDELSVTLVGGEYIADHRKRSSFHARTIWAA